MAATIVDKTLDELFTTMPTGSLDKAILNNLSTLNHRMTPNMLPSNRDMPGLVFFVRPQLNMQKDNLRNMRQLSQLLTNNMTSMQTYIRCMLDPRLMTGVSFNTGSIPSINCPIIDNLNAFITPFTNNCTSMSGWPSISAPTFTSKPGQYNEAFSMVDGRVLNNEAWDLNVNFKNTRGDPILFMLYVWVLYMSFIFEGKLVPYLDFITENELDYCTRIYHITTDYQRRYVTKIAATHASFPIGVPVGDPFNFNAGQPYSEANKDIGVTFRCMGVDYFDTILIKEFNDTVGIFNPGMKDALRSQLMVKIPWSLINSFNFARAYPRINPFTSELEYYVSTQDFNKRAQGLLSAIPEYNASEEVGD